MAEQFSLVDMVRAVFADTSLKPVEKLVLLALARHADGNGECWPSQKLIAEETSLSDRAVRAAVKALHGRWITHIPRGGKVSTYRVTPEPRSAVQPVTPESHSGVSPPTPEPRSGHPGTTFLTPRNDVPDTPEPRSDEVTHISNPLTTQEVTHKRHVRVRPSIPDDYTADFEEFWRAYPKHVEKRRAFACWNARLNDKARPPTPQTLIQAAAHYRDHCEAEGTEERYIKHPATFLGPARPYEDYIQPRSRDKPKGGKTGGNDLSKYDKPW